MQVLRNTANETWRFLRLIAVGCAWGFPFALVAFVNSNPGVSSHPRLASALEASQWPMVVAGPFAALFGIGLIAWLTRNERSGSLATVLAILVLPALLGIASPLVARAFEFEAGMLAVLVLLVGFLVVGVVVTTMVLARRIRWFAILWPAAWGAFVVLVWLASTRTSDGGDDLGSGLMFVLAGSLVLGAAVFGALVGFIGPRIAVNMRQQTDELDAFEATHRTSASTRRAGGLG